MTTNKKKTAYYSLTIKRQVLQRDYARRFRNSGQKILGIGVHFDAQERRIGGWEVGEL